MTDKERKLLFEVNSGQITTDDFYKQFPVDVMDSKDYVIEKIRHAVDKGDVDELELAISLIWLSGTDNRFVDILNELLVNPNHRSHQIVTKTIQELKSPTSVPFIRKVLKTNFDYLEYTCSDSDTIAKWFSWALYDIGTKESIDLIREYSMSDNEDIKKEMTYRLSKLKK